MSQEFYRYHTEREIEEAFRFFDKGTNRIEFRPFLRLLLNFLFSDGSGSITNEGSVYYNS